MASMWRRTMLYLGLGPDEEYEDYDLEGERPASRPEPVAAGARSVSTPRATGREGSRPPVREPAPEPATVRPVQAPGAESAKARPAAVRPVPAAANAKPSVLAPTSFNHAQEVADRFKANQPVIVNLQGVDRDLARRLIDFASGMCYGLGGHMERVASQVYLLTPNNVEVSAEERRRLQERGYDA